MRQLIDSIRGRLAFWHALTVATLLVMFAAGSWLFLVRLTGTHADDALQSTTWQFLEAWNGELEEHEFTPAQAADSAITDFRSPDERLLVFDSTGRLIALSNIVPLIPALTRLALDNTQRGPVAALLRSNAERGDSVTTLDEKEFRGVPVRAHTLRVLRKEGAPFPNLFAGGGAARGLSGPADWGYLSGSGLMTATNMGRLAGEAAAALVKR